MLEFLPDVDNGNSVKREFPAAAYDRSGGTRSYEIGSRDLPLLHQDDVVQSPLSKINLLCASCIREGALLECLTRP